MVKENISKILIIISTFLFIVSLYLFVDSYQNKKDYVSNKPKILECQKDTFKNGMMTITNNYILTVKEDGGLSAIKEQEIYYFPVECKYEEMKSSDFLEGYTCVDTYSEDKKITCSKETLDNEKIWYVTYVDSLTTDGYVCK